MKKFYINTKDGNRRSVELDESLKFQPGVRRFNQKDGSGREDWYWVANMMIEAKQNARRWSCTKHGDKGAYELALAQRLEWEKLKQEKVKAKAELKAEKTSKAKKTSKPKRISKAKKSTKPKAKK